MRGSQPSVCSRCPGQSFGTCSTPAIRTGCTRSTATETNWSATEPNEQSQILLSILRPVSATEKPSGMNLQGAIQMQIGGGELCVASMLSQKGSSYISQGCANEDVRGVVRFRRVARETDPGCKRISPPLHPFIFWISVGDHRRKCKACS
jgi:predicted Fe-S protein YdhL (DUF1289 family)